ncbi:hypothetical protein MKX03_013487, partial [Papaver bracteatum]
VRYFHDHATVTSAVGLNQSPRVDVTSAVGTPNFALNRLKNHGKLAALMQHELKLKSFLTLSLVVKLNYADSISS